MGRGCGWVLVGLYAIATLMFIVSGVVWGRHSYSVSETWIAVDGVIVDRILSDTSDSSGPSYTPVIEFDTREGVPRRFEHSVSWGGTVAPVIGDTVQVLHQPGSADRAIIASFSGLWIGPILLVTLGGFGLLVGVVAGLFWRGRGREKPGEPITTSIAGVQPAEFRRVESGFDPAGMLGYRFVVIDGDRREYLSDWLADDPTEMLMATDHAVAIEERAGVWVAIRR